MWLLYQHKTHQMQRKHESMEVFNMAADNRDILKYQILGYFHSNYTMELWEIAHLSFLHYCTVYNQKKMN